MWLAQEPLLLQLIKKSKVDVRATGWRQRGGGGVPLRARECTGGAWSGVPSMHERVHSLLTCTEGRNAFCN